MPEFLSRTGGGFISGSGEADSAAQAAAAHRTAIALQVARENESSATAATSETANYTDGSLTLNNLSLLAVKSRLLLSAVSTHCNTELQAHTAGTAGDALTIAFVADGSGTGSITRSGNDFTFHFEDGVTTVTNFQSAINALAGADDLIDVKTNGTGANVLTAAADVFSATHLHGGTADLAGQLSGAPATPRKWCPVIVDASAGEVTLESINTEAATEIGVPVVIFNASWSFGSAPNDVVVVNESANEATAKQKIYLPNNENIRVPPGHAVAFRNDGVGWFLAGTTGI